MKPRLHSLSNHGRAWGSLTALTLVTVAAGCSDPEPPPTLSLNGPTKVAYGRVCLLDPELAENVPDGVPPQSIQRVAAERCEEGGEFFGEAASRRRIVENAYVTNQLGDSVAVVSFERDVPALIDTRLDVPGNTHIPVGQRPTEIAVSQDGNFLFVYNQASQDLSVVAVELQREIARVPVGVSVSGLFTGVDTQDAERREALYLLSPDPAQILELSWSFSCGGVQDVYVEDCEPELSAELRLVMSLPEGSRPRYATLAPQRDTLWVTFGQRAVIGEMILAATLAEGDTRACADGGAPPCEGRQFGLTFGCQDGIDNDGDGLIDGADPQCLDPTSAESADGVQRSRASRCNDGEDNDGDGLIDGADPDCAFAGDDSERGGVLLPQCIDGIDNDEDGLIDDEDPDCMNSLIEATPDPADPGLPACADGIDNDFDGAVDLQDPGCAAGPDNDTELSPVTACNDGIDNDGDGLIDHPADGDCFGASGTSEQRADFFEYGPVSIDPEGRYLYVVDRREPQVIVIDLANERVLDPNNCANGLTPCAKRPNDLRIGVPVSRLPQSIIARSLEETIAESEEARVDDGTASTPRTVRRLEVTRTFVFANAATTRGSIFFVDVARIIRVQEVEESFDIEGELISETVNVLSESTDLELRLRDTENSEARPTPVTCNINDEVLAYLEGVRGEPVSRFEVNCAEAELPKISPRCDPERFFGCECETDEEGQEICTIPDQTGDVLMLSRQRTNTRTVNALTSAEEPFCGADPNVDVGCVCVFDSSDRSLNGRLCSPGQDDCRCTKVEVTTTTIADDFFIPNDRWEVTYEGALATRSDLVVDEALEGVVRSIGGDFCANDLREGDTLTLLSPITPAPGSTDETCAEFVDRTLVWRVASVSANHLTLAPLGDGALIGLNEDAPPLVEALPTRECFAAGLRAELRPVDEWIVLGERTGLLSAQTSFGGVCVPRFDTPDFNSRLSSDAVYTSPFLSFRIDNGADTSGNPVEPQRDFALSFTTSGRFVSRLLESGPTPTDIQLIDTRNGDFLFVVDAGTNVIRIYGARTNRAVGILF